MAEIKKQMEWMHDTGEEILSAFILPPLQVVAATINFCTLMVHRHPLFELPFKHINDLKINRTVDTSASPTVARKRAA